MEKIQLEIEKFDHQGRGLTIYKSKPLFVSNALPKETVEIKIEKENSKYFEGSLIKIIKKSDKRIKPICPYFGVCGGCDLMHISYEDELAFKKNKIDEILKKYASSSIKCKEIIGLDGFNYRNKVTFKINDGVGYNLKRSNEIINVDYCFLLDDRINNILLKINEMNLSDFNEMTIRTGTNEIMITIDTNRSLFKEEIDYLKKYFTSIVENINGNHNVVYGNDYITNKIGNCVYSLSSQSFFQVNKYQTINLYNKIKEYASLKSTDRLLDLYCGVGTIGIFLSSYVSKVVGVEINRIAIDNANLNKKINNCDNVDFICDTAANINAALPLDFDVVIVDPPRSGLSKDTIDYLSKCKNDRLVYVSCDPMTLARDIKILSSFYELKEITPFDMFKRTSHVECVCVLNRR